MVPSAEETCSEVPSRRHVPMVAVGEVDQHMMRGACGCGVGGLLALAREDYDVVTDAMTMALHRFAPSVPGPGPVRWPTAGRVR